MTREFIDGPITTDAEFDAALGQLLLESIRNDIDPRGSWVYRNDWKTLDLEVMVFELAKEADTE